MNLMESKPDPLNFLCPQKVRRVILEQSMRAKVGHIGSCLSVVEILATLYGKTLEISTPDSHERDRFVLSKGHAALALYATLHLRGWIEKDQLTTFCGSGTLLGVHPEHAQLGIDFSTGSLGMGLGFAAGAALAARMQNRSGRAFALLSDAECNEGSVWEAAMFAAHHRLSNLVCIIDANGQQALGYTEEVLDLSNLSSRWQSFGWDVHCIDGHDLGALHSCFQSLDYRDDRPHVVIANTIFGKGVSFMEREIKWHYLPMNENEFQLALEEVEHLTP